jgi:putative aldouronate transport system substrate-binding protein
MNHRRGFLRLAAGSALAAAAVPGLLAACNVLPVAQSGPGSSGAAPSGGPLRLPTYLPIQGPQTDLPATADGVPPAYTSFPRQLAKSVSAPPGKSGDIIMMTYTMFAPPAPVEQNAAWQEINRQLNANLKLPIISIQDYKTKLNVVISGSELPDMMLMSTLQASSVRNQADFMMRACADLTAYLSGDAAKDYPNLANFPSYVWPNAIVANKLYAVPLIQGYDGMGLDINQAVFDELGISSDIKNADEFMRAAKAVTTPGDRWALGSNPVGYASPVPWFLQIFGAPNQWRNEGGKLIKDYETEAYKAAVAYTRSLWDASVIHPDLPNLTVNQVGQLWGSGKIVMWLNTMSAFLVAWDRVMAVRPDFKLRVMLPFSHDGRGQPVHFLGSGAGLLAVLKKASDDRVRELLGVLNFLAAPFGTQEQLLVHYGVKDVDFSFDSSGNPVLTPRGEQEMYAPWANAVTPPPALYDATSGEAATVMYQTEKALLAMGVKNPVVGLYSQTDAEKGATLNQKFNDGVAQIVFGRESTSSYDQLVSDWRAGGGEQIRAEYQEALQKGHY